MATNESTSDGNTSVIEGIVPVIPTPFLANSEEIDVDSLKRLIDFSISIGVGAVCLPAYGSEFFKLSERERFRLIDTVVQYTAGRLQIIAQSNHPSAKVAVEIAQHNEVLGADLISFAIPHVVPLTQEDVFEYCVTICDAVHVPVLIQDFNPGGPTIGAEFCRRLADRCTNFLYVKLEESLMDAKVEAIRHTTNDRVGVLAGTGGIYMLQLLQAGICGVMPGLAFADVLLHIWRLAKQDRHAEAMDVFEKLVPQLVFGSQNLELFLHLEKRLLTARNIIQVPLRRSPAVTFAPSVLAHGEFLNQRVLRVIESVRMTAANRLPTT